MIGLLLFSTVTFVAPIADICHQTAGFTPSILEKKTLSFIATRLPFRGPKQTEPVV
jgi:hypothetical protein